jgi:aerobic-type carbon monoxide dehydrogenase small subunit (CoxS/CutS family)
MAMVLELFVNGRTAAVNAEGERDLLSVLRDDLELRASKFGCGVARKLSPAGAAVCPMIPPFS